MEQGTIVGTVIGVMILAGIGAAFILYPLSQNQLLPIIKPAPDFTLINQDNETVSLQQFSGKVIMLGFIYTSCSDEFCPLMTDNFKTIQDVLGASLGTDAMLICITLDPLFDTPTVLRNYALSYDANFTGWQFLTAYDLAPIQRVVDDYGVLSYTNELEQLANLTDDNTTISYKVSHGNESQPSILIHSWISMLIDKNLMIRKVYTKVSWILSAAIEDMQSLI
ncbi:MAG: SCO family protein [Candidatus Hodarchaeales archaeon]|jgi:cytochrome oxidase Cu insertion factor (SCO1/SenC/PrrC family)